MIYPNRSVKIAESTGLNGVKASHSLVFSTNKLMNDKDGKRKIIENKVVAQLENLVCTLVKNTTKGGA